MCRMWTAGTTLSVGLLVFFFLIRTALCGHCFGLTATSVVKSADTVQAVISQTGDYHYTEALSVDTYLTY